MDYLLNVLFSIVFDGVAYGMILFIISVGLSITMGLMGFVNLAHGAFAMAGGYVAVTLMNQAGVPFALALIAAFLAVAAFSVAFERILYARLYGAGELDQVLLTIGLVFMSIAAATYIWGPSAQPITLPAVLTGRIDLGIREVPVYRLFMIVAGAVIMVALWLGFERTRFGAQIRAAVDNRRMTQSLGINVDRLFTVTFAVGSGLAAVGGGLGVEIWGLDPDYPIEHLIIFLIVVAVGGLGSIKGAFVAALLLGVIDNAGKYLLPEFGSFFIYVTMIAVLLLRPAGLFGRS